MSKSSPNKLLLILILLFLGIARTSAQSPQFSELEKVVQSELEQTKTPGAVVAIVKSGRVIYNKGFGVANIETNQLVSPDMLFRIGSMTKMYTAATLLTLAEEGKIDLNAPIGKYLEGLSPRIAAITAHQLMSHSAGLADRANLFGSKHDESALIEGVRDINDSLFFTDPGAVFSYANPGWILAGYLIEKLSGEPYPVAVEKRVLKPLGMAHTMFQPTVAMTYPFSLGHGGEVNKTAVVLRPMEDNAREWPEGFLFSTSSDLARFAIAFMNRGQLDEKPQLSEKIIAKMSSPYVKIPSQVEEGSYGYGLMTIKMRGVDVIEHGGTMAGFASDFVMIPAQQAAVIVLANRRTHLMGTVEKALELAAPVKPKPADPKPQQMTAQEIDECVGVYRQGLAKLELVKFEKGIAYKQGNTQYPLTKIGKDLFTVEVPGFTAPLQVSLVRGADGKIAYFHIRLRAYKRQA